MISCVTLPKVYEAGNIELDWLNAVNVRNKELLFV